MAAKPSSAKSEQPSQLEGQPPLHAKHAELRVHSMAPHLQRKAKGEHNQTKLHIALQREALREGDHSSARIQIEETGCWAAKEHRPRAL